MTAWSQGARGGGFLAAVATRASGWLLEPPLRRPQGADDNSFERPVIAVVALAPRCGTTTVARALAVELAHRDGDAGVAIVSAAGTGAGVPRGLPAVATTGARRLARGLPSGVASAAGRLCLIDSEDPAVRELAARRPAPVVLDVPHGEAPESALALADFALLVAAPGVEPVLADVVADALTRGDRAPLLVLNRVAAAEFADGWSDRELFPVGESRLGSRLALAGRDPTPALARPVAEIADRLEELS